MKRLLATATIIALAISIIPNSYAATPKAGAKCSKAGATSTYAGKKFTCVKLGKKLVWNKGVKISTPKPDVTPTTSATPTTILKGSFKNPYRLGESFKVNNFTLTVKSVESDVTNFVCTVDHWSFGAPDLCTSAYDSNFNLVVAVDPTKSDRYVRWQIAARNDSNDIESLESAVSVRMTDLNGALLSSEFGFFSRNLINWGSQLIPGGTINSYVYFQLSKSVNLAPLLLVIQSSNYFDDSSTIYVANSQ
jgi:hypothetical protein